MHVHIQTPPSFTAHTFRGIGTYAIELHQALQRLNCEHTFSIGDQKNIKADIIHYPFFDFFFATFPLIKKAPTVVTIHDTIPLLYKDEYPRGIKGNLKFIYQKFRLKSADAIITDSEVSKTDIASHLTIPPNKIHAIHLAPSAEYSKDFPAIRQDELLAKYELKKNAYVLYVGDINYNKNLPLLLKVFSQIKTDKQLVMVSKALSQKSKEAADIRGIIATHNLIDRVKVLPRVPKLPQKDLLAIYKGASWYIQPSLYEGFGLPPLEAMAAGTPVISSKGGSLKEILSNTAIMFDPTKPASMKKAITFALRMSQEDRSRLIVESSLHVQKFSWANTAQQTLKVYESIN